MWKKFIFLFLFLSILLISGCSKVSEKFNLYLSDKNSTDDNYTGSYYAGNYVWGGAMNLAWNDLSENIIEEEIKLNTDDKKALETTEKLNNSVFSKNDLDEFSYYIKSGYGQKTVDLINKESRQKFPDKSFKDLEVKLKNKDIIAYAYFLKQVEYLTQFSEVQVKFKDENVEGFYAKNDKQKDNISIIKYWDDDKFILSLELKDNSDQLFLAKGFKDISPKEIVDEINKYYSNSEKMSDDDIFKMPKLQLDYHRNYEEMINKCLSNINFKEYFINQMFENIKFDMDHKGARVENEAVGDMSLGIAISKEPKKIKKLILDKPFWVIMKKSDSKNPYFILGVNNTELMKKQ